MVRNDDFDPAVPLPPGLTIAAIRKSIEYVERELPDLVDLYFEQANIFSGLVGIFASKALDANSVYEKNRHIDLAQQRFPDLKRRGSGDPPAAQESLECKASKRLFRGMETDRAALAYTSASSSVGCWMSVRAPWAESSSAVRNPHSAPTAYIPAATAVSMSVFVSPR